MKVSPELLTNVLHPAATEKRVCRTRELLICLLLSTGFGIFVCSASNKILNRQSHRTETVEMERAILRGQPFYMSGRLTYISPWQNRILFPALLELGAHLGVFGVNGWYLLLRLLFSIAMFAAFWLALRTNTQAGFKLAGAGLLLLTYCLVLTFNSPFELTWDFPDAMFTAIFIIASLRRKRLLLLTISIVSAANRETSVFAGIIWFFLYGIDQNRKINWREAGYAALVSICSYITVILLRYASGGTQAIATKPQFLTYRMSYYLLRDFVRHPTPFSWVGLTFCMLMPCVIWIALNQQSLIFIHKRLLGAACTMAAISAVSSAIGDLRIYIPSLVLAIFVAVWAEANHSAPDPDYFHTRMFAE